MELPITAKKEEIMEALDAHQTIIIVGQTGSGKSTQVPQYCLESGRSVLITQPRRLAAMSVAARVAEEMGMEVGDVVGYHVARDRKYTNDTSCLFATDGLALIRELLGNGVSRRFQVICLDEIHEWNLNQEVLIAYIKYIRRENPDLKIIIMSATMEAEKLSAFFDGAPIINVEGRTYPVHERRPKYDLIGDTAALLREGRNVLVFQPGKKEIQETVEDLRKAGVSAEILPLHSELDFEEQQRCFKSYGKPKCIVATNVAQTSITIPDIDAVVDSGMEKRLEIVNGVETLMLCAISLADAKQRAGRAGRCKEGIYIDHCQVHPSERQEFPVAEMLRRRLDQTVLRLMEAGFDPEKLEFFHQPEPAAIHDAIVALRALGCLDSNGYVTEIGTKVAELPVSVKAARMIVEAIKRNVVFEVITIASIIEVGGIIDRQGPWRIHCIGEKQSDLLAQLQLWKAAWGKNSQWLRENGVFAKNFRRACETRQSIEEALQQKGIRVKSTSDRDDILRSVCAGLVEHCYRNQYGGLKNAEPFSRQLDNNSIVNRFGYEWFVGFPMNIPTPKGDIRIVKMVTGVDLKWLMEVAPHLIRWEKGLNLRYDSRREIVVGTNRVYFANHLVEDVEADCSDHPDAAAVKANALNEDIWRQWLMTKNVTITIPRIDSDEPMPQGKRIVYGKCKFTDIDLIAYGTVVVTSRWLNQCFDVRWTRDGNEALTWYREAATLLAEKRAEINRHKEEQRLHDEVRPLHTRLDRLMGYYNHQRFTSQMREKLTELRRNILRPIREVHAKREQFENSIKELEDVIAAPEVAKPAVLNSTGKGGLRDLSQL